MNKSIISLCITQGRIQDFKLGGGGALKFFFGVRYFVWKITILRQKIIFFPILGGRPPSPWIRPCEKIYIKCKANTAHNSIEHVRIVSVVSRPVSYWPAPTQTSMATTEFSTTIKPRIYEVSHDIASSEKWCQCLDKKVQDFSVVKQNSNMRISK